MKKTIILAGLILLVISNIFSQNNINPPVLSGTVLDTLMDDTTYFYHTVNFNDTNIYKKTVTDFIRGWNYADLGRQLDKLNNINYNLHSWMFPDTFDWDHFGDSINWYIRISPVGGSYSDVTVCASYAMYYEPAITVDTNESFTAGPENIDGAVFGFRNKDSNLTYANHGAVTNNTLDTTKPILSGIWPNDELRYWDKIKDEVVLTNGTDQGYEEGHYGLGDQRDKFNAREMFLSINLQSMSAVIDSNLDVPLLKLKIKIKAKKVTSPMDSVSSYIKFDTVPGYFIQDINSSLGQYRGKTRNDTTTQGGVPINEFVITPRMLITQYPSTVDEPITLSAKFHCYYDRFSDPLNSTNFFNPYFKPTDNWQDSINGNRIVWVIDTMDIEVWYSKASGYDCSVNWVKLETPGMREMFRGQHDKYIHRKVSQVQDMFRNQTTTHNKIAGYYSYCEYSKNQYAPAHYFTMLMDSMSNAEINSLQKPSQFLLATGYKSFWNGVNLDYVNISAVPFIRRGINYPGSNGNDRTFGWLIGYGGYYAEELDTNKVAQPKPVYFSDSAIRNSKYETVLRSIPERNTFEINDYSIYELNDAQDGYLVPWGKLMVYEKMIYRSYYNRRSVLFGNKPWYSWQWINSAWVISADFESVYNYGNTPLTGEELSLLAFQPIAFGAKGQFFWNKVRAYGNDFHYDSTSSDIVHVDLQPSSDHAFQLRLDAIEDSTGLESILTHEEMYGDFINFTKGLPYDTLYRWGANTDTSLYDWNLMNIQHERVYLGLNSIRTGLARHNQWIKKNSSFLVQQKLVCWLGKGFSRFYQQDTGYAANILYNYIDSNSIKTRPFVYRDSSQNEQSSAIDSGFYDIMIHKQANIDIDKGFTMAIVNRRTDPLVYAYDTLETNWDEETDVILPFEGFRFYSTYEMEYNCDNGGEVIDPTTLPEWSEPRLTIANLHEGANYWRNMYWKRQGSREIRFRFNYHKPGNDSALVLLRIKEIVADNAYNDSMPWWQKDRFNNSIIDTVIRSNQELVLKMLPGAGRMFNVEIQNTAPFFGELANSNQTKIIAYPAHQTSNREFSGQDTSLYYHVVYQKKLHAGNYNTFYRKSLIPYNRNVSTKVIQWGIERPLISNLKITTAIDSSLRANVLLTPDSNSCNCKFPTIVARWDSVNNMTKVYTLSVCSYLTRINADKVFIVERTFPAVTGQVPIGDTLLPIGIAYTDGNDAHRDKYGVPTLNASVDGEYMAWNDYRYGIKAGFKLPHDSGFVTNLTDFRFNDTSYKAYYPSLNSYSKIAYGENYSGLAWQEGLNNGISKIYYTILRRDINGNIYKYVPKKSCDSTVLFFNNRKFNIDSTIVQISPDVLQSYYTYPQLYRNVENGFDQNGDGSIWGGGDRVYWQGSLNNDTSSFYIKMIDLGGGLNCFNCLYPKRVYSGNSQLSQPNASQGDFRLDTNRGPFNWSDSAYVVNFISYPYNEQPSYSNSSIYQIDHDYWGIFQFNGTWNIHDTLFQKIDTNITPIGTGLYPHLVSSPVLRNYGDWKINNRIYESTNGLIKTSETYFLKGESQNKSKYPMLKFVDLKTGDVSSFSPFALSDDINPLRSDYLKINAFEKRGISYKALDTISTSWFRIGNMKDLSFFTDGNELKDFNVILERQKDKKKFTMPTKTSKQSNIAMNKLHLINGKNDFYRIIWIKNNDSIIVTSDLLIGDKIDFEGRIDTASNHELGKNVTLNENIIDLNWDNIAENNNKMNIMVCPNPAKDIIYASTNLPIDLYDDIDFKTIRIKYMLINSIGQIITKTEAAPGEVISFSSSDLPSGSYFLKADCDYFNSNIYNNLQGYKTIVVEH